MFPGEFNSDGRCERMCVHVYMVLAVLNHGVLLINMVISKQRGVLGIAVLLGFISLGFHEI